MQPSSHQLSLRLMQRCPSCHGIIQQENIRLISESESSIFAHIQCSACFNSYLTYVTNSEQGVIGNAMLTDLSYDESVQLVTTQPFSEDEFLKVFSSINNNTLLEKIHSELHTKRKDI